MDASIRCFRFGPSSLKCLAAPSHQTYNFGTGPFSAEAWVRTLSGGVLVGRKALSGSDGTTAHGGWFLAATPGGIVFRTDNGYTNSTWATSGALHVCDDKWHHVAGVRSGSTAIIYLDGVAVATSHGGSQDAMDVNSVDRLTIGSVDQLVNPAGGGFLTGYLCEIRVWNAALTADAVAENMYKRLAPAAIPANLVGYWTGIFGATADFSGRGNAVRVLSGTNCGSDRGPPLAQEAAGPFWALFQGVYDASIRVGTLWAPTTKVAVTQNGFLLVENTASVAGATVLENWTLDGTTVSWPLGSMRFGVGSDNAAYWDVPQEVELFEGTHGSDAVGYRGTMAGKQVGAGTLLNVGTGLVVQCSQHTKGGDVVLCTVPADLRDQFAKFGSGGLVNADSGLALVPDKVDGPGAKLVQTDDMAEAGETWVFNDDGTIVLSYPPGIALSAGAIDSTGVRSITTAALDSADLDQHWMVLRDSQHIFHGLSNDTVLTGTDSGAVTVECRRDGVPSQSWYMTGSSLICANPLLALTATGGSGSRLTLQGWAPDNVLQLFTVNDGAIIHDASGLIVVSQADGNLILAPADTNGENTQWHLGEGPPPSFDRSGTRRRRDVAAAAAPVPRREIHQVGSRSTATPTVNSAVALRSGSVSSSSTVTSTGTEAKGFPALYIVTIKTDGQLIAGTDEPVDIQLVNTEKGKRTPFVRLRSKPIDPLLMELRHSSENVVVTTFAPDPFERGQWNRFFIEGLEDIGVVTKVLIRYADWAFWVDWWIISSISVTNVNYNITSWWEAGDLGFQMDRKTTYPFSLSNQYTEPVYDWEMSLCKAPAQDPIGGSMGWEHTWLEVTHKLNPAVDGEPPTVFLDCAGGHGIDPKTGKDLPGVVRGLIKARCNISQVVNMSTGQPLGKNQSPKVDYGLNITSGAQNANVRTEGTVSRDGSCHHIANRYLWACMPPMSISDVPMHLQPKGYGYSCIWFGPYGNGWIEWANKTGFTMDLSGEYLVYPSFWAKTVAAPVWHSLLSLKAVALDFRAAVRRPRLAKRHVDEESAAFDPAKYLVNSLYKKKFTSEQIARILTWDVGVVKRLLGIK